MSRARGAARNVPRAPRCSFRAVIVTAVVIAVSCAAQDAAVWADHSATSCIFRVSGSTHPVTYLGEPRQNPDDTYYPGDAFYYVFRWSEQSDDPAGCSVRAPLLETSRLQLDHRAIWVDSNGREDRRAPLAHRDLDPSVAFLASTDFYAGRTAASCKEMFSKPGESHTWRYDKWVVYDKAFLTKDTDRLTEFEKTLKSKGYGGEPAWGWWTDRIDTKSRHVQDLPYCPWAKYKGGNIKGGVIPADQKLNDTAAGLPAAPPHMKPYGGGIFYVTTHGWGITTGAGAPHAHLVATPADPGSTEWFEERVREACGGLGARSGCVYGTAEVRPDRGVCVSDAVDSYARLLDAWHKRLPPYDIQDGDGDRAEPPPPPPGYPADSWAHLLSNRSYAFTMDTVPPGMPPEAYRVSAGGDACAGPATDGAKLELTASGHYWTPQHRANGIPVRGLEEVSVDRGPSLQDGGLSIILTKPPLHHAEGYDAKNLDGTYYHGDPIYVRHEPSWKWKDERSAHVSFETHRLPPVTLPVIDEFDCLPPPSTDGNGTVTPAPYTVMPPCEHTAEVDSPPWLAEILWFGNGDGLTVRTSDTSRGFGTYEFAYNMTAYNLGRQVADAANSTEAEVVPYEPSYETVHSYPVLADAREYAFDDRHGIAMRYGGSWQDDVLHPMRRSFINGWDGTGGGHDPYTYNPFAQAHVLGTGRNSSPTHIALEHVQDTQTAMFVQGGHGTILFEWPVSGWVFSTHNQTTIGEPAAATTVAKAAVNENVTSHLQIYSHGFADKDTLLYETKMRYPEMPFSKRVVIQSIDHAGAIQAADDITLRVTPYMELGAEYLTDYIRDKITWDTGDPIIAQIVLNDTHSMTQEWHTSNGVINAAILRTSVHFGDIAIQNATGLPFSDRLADLHELAEHPETLRLTAPYDLGLSVLAPTSLYITINGSGEHAIHHKYYPFGGSETMSINAQKSTPADISREPGRITIRQPENFGIIKHVEINGTRLEQPCPTGCTVLFQPDTVLYVTLYNEWGGEARGAINVSKIIGPPQVDESGWQVVGLTAALLVSSYATYRILAKRS
ncbi:MAG: hypothetical protein OXI27_09125 [Thaumarchaeota archaeon]|nr:hypothetical protein [Nitrososphaerota archaeon]